MCELGRLVSQCLRLLETPHPRIDDQSRAPGPLCTGNSRPITARLPLRFGLLVLYRNSTDRASTRHQGPRCCRWPHSRRLAPGRKSQWHKMPMLRCRPFFDWLFLLQIFVTGPASRLWQAGCCENTAGSLRLSTLRFEVEPWKTSDTGLFVMDCKAPPPRVSTTWVALHGLQQQHNMVRWMFRGKRMREANWNSAAGLFQRLCEAIAARHNLSLSHVPLLSSSVPFFPS